MNDENAVPSRTTQLTVTGRRLNKPLIERRRRQRINDCLDELKSILATLSNNENSYLSKLEKADILELTVRCIRDLRQRQSSRAAIHRLPIDSYALGYDACVEEVVTCFRSSAGDMEQTSSVVSGLLDHLKAKRRNQHRTDVTRGRLDSHVTLAPPNGEQQTTGDVINRSSNLSSHQMTSSVGTPFHTNVDISVADLSTTQSRSDRDISAASTTVTSSSTARPADGGRRVDVIDHLPLSFQTETSSLLMLSATTAPYLGTHSLSSKVPDILRATSSSNVVVYRHDADRLLRRRSIVVNSVGRRPSPPSSSGTSSPPRRSKPVTISGQLRPPTSSSAGVEKRQRLEAPAETTSRSTSSEPEVRQHRTTTIHFRRDSQSSFGLPLPVVPLMMASSMLLAAADGADKGVLLSTSDDRRLVATRLNAADGDSCSQPSNFVEMPTSVPLSMWRPW